MMKIKTISRSNMHLWTVLLLATMSVQLAHSQITSNTGDLTQHPCTSNGNCHECIQVSDCAWCAQPNIANTTRCFSLSGISGNCREEFIYNPDNELRLTIAKQLARSDSRIEGLGDVAAYIFPQRVNLKVRKNQAHRINVTYSQSEDFPVDLYYLMGSSMTSEDDKKKFSSLGAQLASDGLDAVMQAITCRQQIGWREMARRILVFGTDADFHQSGDGNLFVATTPNDGLCHINTNGEHTDSTIFDHPSISQINWKVKQNAINIIFAVTPNKRSIYEHVSRQIEGSSLASLSDDSSNVVELVRDEYSKISSSVEMKDSAPSAIKVTYHSACLHDGVPVPTHRCDGLKSGDTVVFEAEIVITECPSHPKDWFQTFQIYPVGIGESLTVDLEMLCGCPCETRSPNCEGQ